MGLGGEIPHHNPYSCVATGAIIWMFKVPAREGFRVRVFGKIAYHVTMTGLPVIDTGLPDQNY